MTVGDAIYMAISEGLRKFLLQRRITVSTSTNLSQIGELTPSDITVASYSVYNVSSLGIGAPGDPSRNVDK